MSLEDAFALGWICGSSLSFLHTRNGIYFDEAMKRFRDSNKKNGIPLGYIDPIFGFVDCEKETVSDF